MIRCSGLRTPLNSSYAFQADANRGISPFGGPYSPRDEMRRSGHQSLVEVVLRSIVRPRRRSSQKEDKTMPPQLNVTVGIDLGDRHSHLCLLDTHSGEVIEESRIPTTLKGFERRFCGCGPMHVVIEAGTRCWWPTRGSSGSSTPGEIRTTGSTPRTWRASRGSTPSCSPRSSTAARSRRRISR